MEPPSSASTPGRLGRVDDAAARAVKGVRQIVVLDDVVAVVADHMGAAKKGLAALVIEWDDGPHAGLTTDAIAAELERATLKPGIVDAEERGSIYLRGRIETLCRR